MDLEKEGKGNQEIAREQLDQWIKLDLFVGNRWCVWFPCRFMDAWYMHVILWLGSIIGMENFLHWQSV